MNVVCIWYTGEMKVWILVLVITGALALAFIFLRSEKDITNYPPKNEKIVAFGDSLVFGMGATSGHDFVSLLATKLNRDIVNLGVSGNTTADGIARMHEVLENDPGVIILLLGGNDYLRRLDETKTRANLSTLIETFQKQGAVVVLLGVRGGIIRDGRGEMYEELSEKFHTLYLEDVLDGIFLKPELMFDGIHPNDAGYAIIADRLHEIFVEEKL